MTAPDIIAEGRGRAAEKPPVAQPHLAAIDAVRGYAILLVLMVHAPVVSGAVDVALIGRGARGVQLFYIVSAFTLCHSMAWRISHAGGLYRNYFIRRLFRILPMFYVTVLVNFLWLGFEPRYFAPNGLTGLDIASALVFLNAWIPNAITSVVDGGWSVAIEMNFYVLFPLLFMAVTSVRTAVIATLVLWAAGYGLSQIGLHWARGLTTNDAHVYIHFFKTYWLPRELFVFAAGFLLYHLYAAGHFQRAVAHPLAVWVPVAIVPVFFAFGRSIEVTVVLGLIFAGFLLAQPGHPFNNRVVGLIGRVSYSMYLLHFLVNRALGPVFGAPHFDWMPDGMKFACAYALSLALSFAVSWITWTAIEKPGIAIGRRLSKWLDRRQMKAA